MKSFLPILMLLATYTLPARAAMPIFACEPEWAALADELGGDKVEAYSATTGLQDPHQIQARPSLIAKIRDAKMIVCTGAELEVGWLPLLLQRASNPNVQQGKPGYFMATQYVKMLGIPQQIDRSQGDIHAAGNPHIQTSPDNILLVAKAMIERFTQLDSSNTAYYQQRLQDFELRWRAALQHWKDISKPLKQMTIVVHHNSWLYLEDWLDLNNVATLEDKPGLPPTSGHLAEIVSAMKLAPAKAIIVSGYQSDKPAKWLSDKTGIPVVILPFTVGGTDQAQNLFSLFDDTFERLLRAVAK